MNYKDIINKIKPELDQIIVYFKDEIAVLRTGRATPALVEKIKVDCYGSKMEMNQIASIHAPEPRVLIISPWDKTILGDIEKAIRKSELNLSPVVDGEAVRIVIPPLSGEEREKLIKILNEKMEEARVAIRRHREEAWREIQEVEKGGEIREDDKFRGKDELQKLVDGYNEKISETGRKKEDELRL